MAIKVNGTTVIDDSRNISNVGTVTATSFSGDGSALTGIDTAPPTTFDAVGTYTSAFTLVNDGETLTGGTTRAASSLYIYKSEDYTAQGYGKAYQAFTTSIQISETSKLEAANISGTWRLLSGKLGRPLTPYGNDAYLEGLWIRIS